MLSSMQPVSHAAHAHHVLLFHSNPCPPCAPQPEDLYAQPSGGHSSKGSGYKAPLTRVVATPCYRCAWGAFLLGSFFLTGCASADVAGTWHGAAYGAVQPPAEVCSAPAVSPQLPSAAVTPQPSNWACDGCCHVPWLLHPWLPQIARIALDCCPLAAPQRW